MKICKKVAASTIVSKIFYRIHCICLKNEEENQPVLLSVISKSENLYPMEKDVVELNGRYETLNKTHDLSRFYKNNVYLTSEESNRPSSDMPPSYDNLFGAKELSNCNCVAVMSESDNKAISV